MCQYIIIVTVVINFIDIFLYRMENKNLSLKMSPTQFGFKNISDYCHQYYRQHTYITFTKNIKG